MTNAQQIAEATAIHQIIAPWLPITDERELWTVTLTGGTEITILAPLGAAADVERAGHHIRAFGPTDADNTLDGWPLLPGEGLLGPARW